MFRCSSPRPFTTPPVYNPISDLFGRWHARRIRALEKRIGYSLRFPRIPEAWIQACASFDLSSSWKSAGLNVTGIDYFTLGTVLWGRSTRFCPGAETFQSWIGGYLVRLNEHRAYSLQEHLNLAVIDQVNWLRHYGDPNPSCDLPATGFQVAGNINVSGYSGNVYVGGGYSHIDIGAGKQGAWQHVAAGVLSMVFNANRVLPQIRAADLMPRTTAEAYARIFLKGIIVIVEIQPNVHAVLYGNGVVLKDRNGVERDTFELTKERIFEALRATVIAEL